jgi:DNA-binding IclR family transcriptional regulator
VSSPQEVESRTNGSRIAVIDKAVRVLDVLMRASSGLTPTEVANAVETNRSTAFRLLTSLEQAGLLYRDALTGRYRLGVKFLQYGESVRAGMALVDLADPTLRKLSAETAQSVSLAIREGFGARYIHRVPGPEVEVFAWKVGDWRPLYGGGAALAILSALPDEEIERFLTQGEEGRTRQGGLSNEDIRDMVATARARGWSLSSSGITPGISTLGVPVLDSAGSLVCSISVAGLEHHYQGVALRDTANAVVAAAHELSLLLK